MIPLSQERKFQVHSFVFILRVYWEVTKWWELGYKDHLVTVPSLRAPTVHAPPRKLIPVTDTPSLAANFGSFSTSPFFNFHFWSVLDFRWIFHGRVFSHLFWVPGLPWIPGSVFCWAVPFLVLGLTHILSILQVRKHQLSSGFPLLLPLESLSCRKCKRTVCESGSFKQYSLYMMFGTGGTSPTNNHLRFLSLMNSLSFHKVLILST